MATLALSLAQRHALTEAAVRLQREFDGTFNLETIQRYLDDSLERLSGAVYLDYVSLLAERFARERLTAIAQMEGLLVSDTPTVLFLCVHNAGRSQMASGWLRHLAGDRVQVLSGGSAPAETINPSAVEAMAEKGIDITDQYPKPWTDETVGVADVIVSMGCGDACPVLPGKRYLDWELEDPAGKGVDSVRPIRDDIEQRVRRLMDELGVETADA
ncbi:MAG: arsenate reductase ArsC [Nitriliruptor sp.]|nr:MAG: arsenate reductase ArsC [Nitriliruptor sp.]